MKRIFHHCDVWECVRAGMYSPADHLDHDTAIRQYAEFLRDIQRFEAALQRVLTEWPISCEQFLSNDSINRVAWLGQAAMCIETGVPRLFRAGFKLLTDDEQRRANIAALKALFQWQTSQRRLRNSSASGSGKDIPTGYQIQFWTN